MTTEGIKDVPRNASKKLAWAALVMALAWLPAFFLSPYVSLWPALALFVGAPITSIVAVGKAKREPSRYAGLWLARAALGVFAMSILAFVVPSLMKVRVSTGETPVPGELRSMISAMQTYASVNGGFFDSRLECLARPGNGDCIPGYPAAALPFLGENMLDEVRHGYRFTYYPGEAVAPERLTDNLSPTSVLTYAYTAEPLNKKRRSPQYCASAVGWICAMPGDAEMTIAKGQCPPPLAENFEGIPDCKTTE